MQIISDSVGNVILNNGAHRVILSPEVVEAIGAHVYAASPPSEIEGRMVVVELPPRKVAIRPGEGPTVDEPSMPVCPSCLVPAELVSVQCNGPECALGCPKCEAGWTEEVSEEVIEVLLGAEEEPTSGYGAFPGGDPRAFEPDPEVCTPAELEAHRLACEEAAAMEARGEVPDWPGAHHWGQCSGAVVHVAAGSFGVGIYSIGHPKGGAVGAGQVSAVGTLTGLDSTPCDGHNAACP